MGRRKGTPKESQAMMPGEEQSWDFSGGPVVKNLWV